MKVLGINKDKGQYAQETVTEGQMRLPVGEFRGCCVKDPWKLSIHSIFWEKEKEREKQQTGYLTF